MLSTKLKNIRKENNLLQKDIAKEINIAIQTYAKYEQGKAQPDIETLKNLADFYNVSVDYLIGRADEDNIVQIYNDLSEDEEHLISIIRKLNDLNKEIIYQFAEFTLKQQMENKKK